MSLPFSDPVYLFALLLLILWLAPLVAQRLRLPPLVVLIALGAVVGSNGLGWLAREQQLIFLERIGLLYIMLIAGLQMDLQVLRRLGARALVFGALTFGIPFGVGMISAPLLAEGVLGAVVVGTVYAPHALMAYPIVAGLGLVGLEAISITVGGTLVATILTLATYAVVRAIQSGSLGIGLWIRLGVVLPAVMALCLWGIPKLSQWLLPQGSDPARGTANSTTQGVTFVLACVFLMASVTHALGVDAIVGAFVCGLAFSGSVSSESPVMDRILFVGNGLFIPIFAVSVGVLSDLGALVGNPQDLGIALFLVIGAVGAKGVAAWIMGARSGYSPDQIWVMFGLTLSRSALVLVIGLFGREAGLLNESSFNALVIYIVLTCLLGPLIVDRFGRKIAQAVEDQHQPA